MELLLGDCIEILKEIPSESINLILADLPYGVSANTWDKIIDFDSLWKEYKRIIKEDGAICLFANEPFTTKLINSNMEMYKYNWVWNKRAGANFITSHYQPLRVTEDICVFGKLACSYNKAGKAMKYNPQFTEGKPYTAVSGKQKQASIVRGGNGKGAWQNMHGTLTVSDGKRYPTNILEFSKDKEKLHPTQKPVKLLEYLIKTYTDPGDIVLDNCMGAGSTGVAAVHTGRDFIGIEIDKDYYDVACKRIDAEKGNIGIEIDGKYYTQDEMMAYTE